MKLPRRASALACCMILAVSSWTSYAHDVNPMLDTDAVKEMVDATSRFTASLSDPNKVKALFEFTGTERKNWNFLPDKFIKPEPKRLGLPITEMSTQERLFAFAMLNTTLSHRGFLQASSIMTLEQVLLDLTKNPMRNPQLYYVSVFGTPEVGKTWGWRFEGHHLSINMTVVKGQYFSVTPTFFATNPGIVNEGSLKGMQVLKNEEDMARALAKSLTPEQFKTALIMEKAPKDIFSSNSQKLQREFYDLGKGIPFSALQTEQKAALLALAGEYVHRFRPELVNGLASNPLTETDSLVFAWGGSLEVGEGHYYRIVTKNHLLEYDNVQDGAHHVHSVWRDFDGDFGENLLLKHHQQDH